MLQYSFKTCDHKLRMHIMYCYRKKWSCFLFTHTRVWSVYTNLPIVKKWLNAAETQEKFFKTHLVISLVKVWETRLTLGKFTKIDLRTLKAETINYIFHAKFAGTHSLFREKSSLCLKDVSCIIEKKNEKLDTLVQMLV